MNGHMNQKRTFELERAETELSAKIAMRGAPALDGHAKIRLDLDRAEVRLDEEVARLQRRFADLEAAVTEIRRCHGNLAPLPVRRKAGKHA